MKAQKNTKIMVTCALLVALQVILARFLSINTTFVVVNFSFLAVALSGILFGPLWALAVGAVSDLIGATLFPFGAFFPGFTVTAALVGLIYGLFLHPEGGASMDALWLRVVGSPVRQPDPARAQQRLALHHVRQRPVRHASRPLHRDYLHGGGPDPADPGAALPLPPADPPGRFFPRLRGLPPLSTAKGTGAEPGSRAGPEASPVLRCQGRPAVSLPRCCRRDAPRDKAGDQAQTQQQRGHGGHHAITHEYPPVP